MGEYGLPVRATPSTAEVARCKPRRQRLRAEPVIGSLTNQTEETPMSDNPLKDNPDRERRIREQAYQLWEEEGRPHGRDKEFWEKARELIAMEEHPDAGLLPNPENQPDSRRETGVEEAQVQENLGEFPDRFADQGEKSNAPKARRAPRKQAATRKKRG